MAKFQCCLWFNLYMACSSIAVSEFCFHGQRWQLFHCTFIIQTRHTLQLCGHQVQIKPWQYKSNDNRMVLRNWKFQLAFDHYLLLLYSMECPLLAYQIFHMEPFNRTQAVGPAAHRQFYCQTTSHFALHVWLLKNNKVSGFCFQGNILHERWYK